MTRKWGGRESEESRILLGWRYIKIDKVRERERERGREREREDTMFCFFFQEDNDTQWEK